MHCNALRSSEDNELYVSIILPSITHENSDPMRPPSKTRQYRGQRRQKVMRGFLTCVPSAALPREPAANQSGSNRAYCIQRPHSQARRSLFLRDIPLDQPWKEGKRDGESCGMGSKRASQRTSAQTLPDWLPNKSRTSDRKTVFWTESAMGQSLRRGEA